MAVSETLILVMLIAGAAFMIFEAIAPGADLIVVGIALFLTGLVGWLIPGATLPVLLLVFIAVAVTSYYLYDELVSFESGEGDQTSGSDDLEYNEGTAVEDITPESGRVNLDEGAGMSTKFQARCPHGRIEEGTRVIVTDAGGGSILEVMPMDDSRVDELLTESERI